jgi:Fe2+ or Zn2+ uptake regulation protein
VADDDRLDALLAAVRRRGGRVTTARRAVLAALLETDGRHLGAEAIGEEVRARHPDVHLSTVYRTLDALEQLGLVVHVHLGHGPSTYHLVDGLPHHAVCGACGAVIELPADVFAGLEQRLADEHGFILEPHHFALAGRCRACAPR